MTHTRPRAVSSDERPVDEAVEQILDDIRRHVWVSGDRCHCVSGETSIEHGEPTPHATFIAVEQIRAPTEHRTEVAVAPTATA